MLRRCVPLVFLLWLAACTQPPPLRGPIRIQQAPDHLQATEIRTRLNDLGFNLASTVDGLPASLTFASHDDRATCRTIYIEDRYQRETRRGRFTRADRIEIQIARTANESLKVTAIGQYLDRYINRYVESPCNLSSRFESELRKLLGSK